MNKPNKIELDMMVRVVNGLAPDEHPITMEDMAAEIERVAQALMKAGIVPKK